ncbi:MAG TPA: DUF1810 domain-containing protein [Opitutaceae bacterium]
MPSREYSLERFIEAQARVYADVIAELRVGRKTSHWMWFVFPQLRGLGRSAAAQFYGIQNLDEARAYLGHPLLGARLVECTGLVLDHPTRTAHEIFGSPDDLKLRSSMTLFDAASPARANVFVEVLTVFYAGEPDRKTLELLASPLE